MNKKYKLGMVLGRFQIFHKGHEYIINEALANCEKVLLFIGSADKSNSYENPFNYEFRKEVIKSLYTDENLIIEPLNDLGVGNVPRWGDYVIESAKNVIGMPDLIIYGIENKCETWYTNYPNLKYLKVDRNDIKTSSTIMKGYLENNNKEEFKKYVSEEVFKYYDTMYNKINSLK